MVLRPYQSRAVDFVTPRARAFVVSPAGSGKTIMASSAVSRVAEPFQTLIWLANTREQVEQAHQALAKVQLPDPFHVQVCCVASRPDISRADIVVIDECHPAGTLIDGRPIESIRPGDYVSSFNHKTLQVQCRKVLKVFSREYNGAIYRLTTRNGRSIKSTSGHPIYFHGYGYIPAGRAHALFVLQKQDAEARLEAQVKSIQVLRHEVSLCAQEGNGRKSSNASTCVLGVRGEVHPYKHGCIQCHEERGLAPVLFDEVQEFCRVDRALEAYDKNKPSNEAHTIHQNEGEKSNFSARGCREDVFIAQGQDILVQGWEWTAYQATANSSREDRSSNGVCSVAWGRSGLIQASAEMLQGGLSLSGSEALHRSGWELAQDKALAILGCTEDGRTELDWVDNIEILERGSDQGSECSCSQNTVYNLHVEELENYFAEGVLVHNCHHLPAATWWETATNANGRVWGFSATPHSGDLERDAKLVSFFGQANFIAIPRSEVQGGGSITDGVVYFHDVDQPGQFDDEIERLTAVETKIRSARFPFLAESEHERRARWQFTAEKVQGNALRNDKIVSLAAGLDACIVLVASIEHGQLLASRIPGSVMVYSRMGTKKRKAAISAFRDGDIPCMIATSLADEGLDVPRAAVLVLAAGGRSAAKLEQRAGRVMRPHESKTIGVVHDFTDRGARMALAQARARAKTYRDLGYTVHTT